MVAIVIGFVAATVAFGAATTWLIRHA